jgi:flagellar biosynthesis protein FlhF
MRLRVVQAPDTREAILRIRADLGADALVLATREVEGGVSVTAVGELAKEEDLSSLLAPGDGEKVSRTIAEALAWHQVPEVVGKAVLASGAAPGGEGPLGTLARLLDRWARFAPLSPGDAPRLMLVGPHGAGKTAATARLLVEAALRGQELRVVCADGSRVAAAAQLRALVAPLGQEPVVVTTAAELGARLHRESRAVVIDTSGLNPFRGDELAKLADLVHAAAAEPVVVMPAGTVPDDAAEMAANLAALGARRLIVTKLDTARRLGSVLAAGAAGLALAGATIAPEIGRPILPLTPAGLARLMLRRSPVDG